MAKVSLGDLMDPLQKINQHSKQSVDSLQVIQTSVAVGLTVQQSILRELQIQTALLKEQQAGYKGGTIKFENTDEATELLKGVGDFVAKIADVDPDHITRVLNAVVLGLKGITLLGAVFNIVMGAFIRKLKSFAFAIVIFAVALALALPIFIIGLPVLFVLAGLFSFLGKQRRSIRLGADALGEMGMAMIKFALGIWLYSKIIKPIMKSPKEAINLAIMMTLPILVLGLAMGLLGKMPVKKGAISVGVMGIALVVWGIAYVIFTTTMLPLFFMDWKAILTMQVAVLLTFGIIFAVAGTLWTMIMKGALAIGVMGIGLIVFSIGYIPFQAAVALTSWEEIGKQATIITGMGLLFAGAGFLVGFIAAGALAFGLIGGALIALAYGLTAIRKVGWTLDDSKSLTTVLVGVKGAFGGAMDPTGGGRSGVFEKLGGVFTSATNAAGMIAGAAAFAAAGKSLSVLSKGLSSFMQITWGFKDTEQLTVALGAIVTAFGVAGGGEEPKDNSLFANVFGMSLKPTTVEKGISSVMGAGDALTSIAYGLLKFQVLTATMDFTLDDKGNYKPGSIGEAVTNTLAFVSAAFATIGKMETKDSGGGGLLFYGMTWDENQVEQGIDAVSGAGEELTNIATGLMSFQKMIDKGIKWGPLGVAVKGALTFVGEAFATIGMNEKTEDGFLGISWDENLVKQGVDAVSGAGTELMTIILSLEKFQAMVVKGVDFGTEAGEKGKYKKGTLAWAVFNTLTFVGEAFATIGGKEGKSEGWFGISWDQNMVEAGIEAVEGAGDALLDIAKGVMGFEGIKDPKALGKAISDLFNSTTEVFILMAENDEYQDALGMVQEFFVELTTAADAGTLEKAAKDVGDLADNISRLEINKMESLGSLMTAFSKANEEMDTGFLGSIAGGIEQMGEGFNKFMGVGDQDVAKAESAATGSTTAPEASDAGMVQLQKSIAGLNSSIKQMNSVLSGLPDDISSIQWRTPAFMESN